MLPATYRSFSNFEVYSEKSRRPFFADCMSLSLTTAQHNLLLIWLPCLIFVASMQPLRKRMARKLRWKDMVLRLTSARGTMGYESLHEKERKVLSGLLQNLTLLSALGSTLAVALMIAPTEIYYDAGVSREWHAQLFIFLSFASVGTYVLVVIECSLTLLYLEQFSDSQLHAILCMKAAEQFVEPLLAFVRAPFSPSHIYP